MYLALGEQGIRVLACRKGRRVGTRCKIVVTEKSGDARIIEIVMHEMIHFIRLLVNLIPSILTSPHRHHQQISELPDAERHRLVADRLAQLTV